MQITNQNAVVLSSGGKQNIVDGKISYSGHQIHYPIFKDEVGVEYIRFIKNDFSVLADLGLNVIRRESVIRK